MKRLLLILSVALAMPLGAAQPPGVQKAVLKQVRFDQNLGAQIPPELTFRDETGKVVHLSDYFGRRPVILSLVHYECPMLCTEALNGLLRAMRSLSFTAGDQYEVVTVSFDPHETPELAAKKRTAYLERYGRPGARWAFLTGNEVNIRALTDTAGFHYIYDPEDRQFGHPTGIVVLTPQGRIAHYLFGVEYSAKDLRLSLIQAGEGTVGSPVDRLILYCYHYDPQSGKYNLAVMRILQISAVVTVLLVLLLIRAARSSGRRA